PFINTILADIDPFYEDTTIPPVDSTTFLQFARPGLQHRMLARLRRGEFRLDAELDLHGFTIEEAFGHLARFINTAAQHNWRCACIIHGKATQKNNASTQPILKRKINQWLRHFSTVLAFCSAKSYHGGTGAVYVLFKSGNQNSL